MHSKDYWNFITHNALRVTSSCKSVAAVLVLYSVISVSYFNYLMMASETPRECAMFGCKFVPGVKKCYHSFPKDAILTNICLKKCQKSDGVNPIDLEYAVFILVTPRNMFSSI